MKKQTIIKANKKKLLWFIILSITSIYICYDTLWNTNPQFISPRRRAGLMFLQQHRYFFIIFMGAVFLFVIIMSLRLIIRKKPYIIVDTTQIIDNSRIMKTPVLKWDDVQDVVWNGSNSPYTNVFLQLKQDSEYLRTFPGLYGKFLRLIYRKRSFSLHFSTVFTKISGQEMYDIFRGYFANYRLFTAQNLNSSASDSTE
ncbi:MAG: hypothetical protein IKV58_01990 [Oscillospiraceae bacterium]|nr:hypothetical protein [Oscillospiraceae bacterium]